MIVGDISFAKCSQRTVDVRALIAEDEEPLAELLKIILEKRGFEVTGRLYGGAVWILSPPAKVCDA